jgi:hypothetical protein
MQRDGSVPHQPLPGFSYWPQSRSDHGTTSPRYARDKIRQRLIPQGA